MFVIMSNTNVTEVFACNQCLTLSAKLKYCGRCRGVKYCSPECQTLAWPEHKLTCKTENFESSKFATRKIRAVFDDPKLFSFFCAFHHLCTKLGWRYLYVHIDGDTVNCRGTNSPSHVTERDLIPGKSNCIVRCEFEPKTNGFMKSVMAFEPEATQRHYQRFEPTLSPIDHKNITATIDVVNQFVTLTWNKHSTIVVL